MKRQIFPPASKYRRRTRREFGGETVEYIIVILAVVVIGGGLMLLVGTAQAEGITPAVETKAMRIAAHSFRPLPYR